MEERVHGTTKNSLSILGTKKMRICRDGYLNTSNNSNKSGKSIRTRIKNSLLYEAKIIQEVFCAVKTILFKSIDIERSMVGMLTKREVRPV